MKNNLTNNIPEEKLDNGISDLPLHKDGALLIPISSRKLVVIRSPSSSSVSSHEPTTRIKSNNLHSKKKLTQRNALHSAGGTGVCSLGKHRTVDGRATLLTPTHAAKLYGVDSNNKLKPSNLFNNEVKRKHTVSSDSVSSSNVGQDDSTEGCFVSDVDSFHTDASFNSLMLPHFPGVGINIATTCSNFPQTVAVNTSTANMGIEHLADSNQNVEHEVYNLQQTQTVQDRKHQLASASLVFNTFSTDDETESVITNMTTDKEEDSEESSLSSTSFDQGLSMLSNEYSANNSTVDEMVCKCEHEQCNTKRKELAQDLKLAEADIAILVSSKQQLQLDIYEISEEKNKLYDQLKTSQTELAVRDKELKFFKKQMESKMEVWETHKTSMNEYVKQLKLELSETSQLLELTQVDRDRNKNELNEKKREVENVMNRNKSLQEECSEMHGKVLRLESFIEKSSNENVESENNFSQLRLVREEYSMQLLTKDRQLADTKNQLQKVEDRLLLTNEAHDKLKNESANVRKALMMQTSSVNQLQSQLSIKSEEKHSLDAVVAKLHKDLFHVEMCLTKLKQEISDKSNIVAREEGVKQQLEMQRKVFKEERVSFKQETQLLKQRIMEKKNEVVELQRKVVKVESEHVRTKEEMQKLTEKTKLHADHLACQVKENAQTCSEYKIKYEKLQCLYQDAVTVKDKSQSELEKTIAKFERKEEELLRLQKELAMMSEKLKQNTLFIELKNKESLKWKEHLQIVTNERDKQVVEVTQLRQNVLMQQQNVGRADHSHEQKEMLAELQATKLNLIAKVEQMQLVEDKMKTEMLKQEEDLMKQTRDVAQLEEMNLNLQNKVVEIEESYNKRLKELSKLNEKAKLEISHLTECNSELRNSNEEFKIQFACEKQRVMDKSNEVSSLLTRLELLNEEVQTAKQEMNSLNIQLVNVLEQKEEYKERESNISEHVKFVTTERDKLKQAVSQQQQYLASLQKHYQQWGEQIKAKLQHSQIKEEKFPQTDVSTQTSCESTELLHNQRQSTNDSSATYTDVKQTNSCKETNENSFSRLSFTKENNVSNSLQSTSPTICNPTSSQSNICNISLNQPQTVINNSNEISSIGADYNVRHASCQTANSNSVTCTCHQAGDLNLNRSIEEKLQIMQSSVSTQTNESNLPIIPNPSDVACLFKTSDAVKLKAYKQTVKVLRKKLKEAEDKSTASDMKISDLLKEIGILKIETKALIPSPLDDDGMKVKTSRLCEELSQWKDAAEHKEKENIALQIQMTEMKRLHGLEFTELKKNRMLHYDKKLDEANGRLELLVDANKKLRITIQNLEIKLKKVSYHLDETRRDKLRYQERSKKLQKNLRSLSWLSSFNQRNKQDSSINSSGCLLDETMKNTTTPASVTDVDDMLKNLRKEVSMLEKQLTEHNSAVSETNTSWREICGINVNHSN